MLEITRKLVGSAKPEHEKFCRLAQYLFYDSPYIFVQASFPTKITGSKTSSVASREESLNNWLLKRENGKFARWEEVNNPQSASTFPKYESYNSTMVFLTRLSTIGHQTIRTWLSTPHMNLKIPFSAAAITALYFPLDEVVTKVELKINGYTSREWTLNDGEWRANDRFEGDMRTLPFPDDVPIERVPTNRINRELQMDKLHLKCALSFEHSKSSYAEPYNRGSIVTMNGRRFQRCVPMDPCIPVFINHFNVSELYFDAHAEILVESCKLCDVDLNSICENFGVPICVKGKQQSASKRESEYFIAEYQRLLTFHPDVDDIFPRSEADSVLMYKDWHLLQKMSGQ